jgi:hypothetical protein
MNIVYIYQFPIERTYRTLIVRLTVAYMVMSVLAAVGIIIFWDIAAMNIVLAYVGGMVLIIVIIESVKKKTDRQLNVRFVRADAIKRINPPPGIYQFHFFNAYHIVCPFCGYEIEIDKTNLADMRTFSDYDLICIHYRKLTTFADGNRYAKFVNQKKLKKKPPRR